MLENGFSSSRIKSWLRSERLVPVAHGVYAFGRDMESREQALRAALLMAGPGAVLGCRTACELWNLVRIPSGIPRTIDLAVVSGNTRHLHGVSPAFKRTEIRVAQRNFAPAEIRRKDGFAVVRPAFALFDFAAANTERDLRFAFLEACRLGLFNRVDVDYCAGRIVGRRGAENFRPLLALWVPELKRVKSVFEGLCLLVWVEREYPLPLVNTKVFGYEVDFFWPGQRFALEVDGGAFHSDPVQKQIDVEKQRALEAEGLTVRRMTYREFDNDPYGALDRVASELGFI